MQTKIHFDYTLHNNKLQLNYKLRRCMFVAVLHAVFKAFCQLEPDRQSFHIRCWI